MPRTTTPIWRISPAALALAVAALVLAACGGSSSKTGSSTSARAGASAASAPAATTPTAPSATKTTPATPQAGRFAALRACIEKAGIPLPPLRPGTPPADVLGGGASKLPPGVSRAQLQAAVSKCTGGSQAGSGLAAGGLKSPAVKAALTAFTGCMRQHGVNLPPPNTSGKGPVFATAGLHASATQLHDAQLACTPALTRALRTQPGGSALAGPQAP